MISQIGSFFKFYGRVFSLLLTMALGSLFPQLHTLSFLIQVLLMVMLFFSFLDLRITAGVFRKSVLWLLLVNIALAFFGYAILIPFDATLALSAFMTAIAPTAIAAPVMIGFLRGEIEYVVTAVLITNLSSALVIPLALPFLLGAQLPVSFAQVLQPVLLVMFVPLILARLVLRLPTSGQAWIRKGKALSFPLWLVNLFIISANASNFLRHENSSSLIVTSLLALVSLVICAVNFGVGALIGGRRHWQEASQSLGQKNLSFVIWISLTFINPLVALGPTFYILFHHLYNSWSILQFERGRQALAANPSGGSNA